MDAAITEKYPWIILARDALQLTIDDDLEAAGETLNRISREHGDNAVPSVLMAWIDMAMSWSGNTPARPQQAVQLGFMSMEDGVIRSIDEVPDDAVWAGRLLAARVAMDADTFNALINAVNTDEDWQKRVSRVLMACANMVVAARQS